MDERHRRIARVALAAAGKFSLALAGGYAIQAHGIGSRPSGDVDLFLNWACRDEFDEAVNSVIAALEAEGMTVAVVARAETFARLLVTDPAAGGEPDKVEVAADWRSHDPVMLQIGPKQQGAHLDERKAQTPNSREPGTPTPGRENHRTAVVPTAIYDSPPCTASRQTHRRAPPNQQIASVDRRHCPERPIYDLGHIARY